jgi:NAD(P)-dependent dehydrogenase (short-subunit alcohol dehydrogenase family)
VENRKIAIVTGGSSGIGFAIAARLINSDIRTIIIGRNKPRLEHACRMLGNLSEHIVCDLTDLKELPSVVKTIIGKHEKIDILVNNAGIHLKRPIQDVSDNDYQQVILNNQTAMFSLTREVSNFMIANGSGAILNISSMASQYGLPGVIAYAASKSAIEGMTRSMAVELSPKGIRVNCIAPGFIKTDMSSAALDKDPERKKRVLARTPLGRLGNVEEVAEAAFFLVSDSASFITGVILSVDGGNSIGF